MPAVRWSTLPIDLFPPYAEIGLKTHILVQCDEVAVVASISHSRQQMRPDIGRIAGANVGRSDGKAEVGPPLAYGFIVLHHLDAIGRVPASLIRIVRHDLIVIFPGIDSAVDQIAVNAWLVRADKDVALYVEAVGGYGSGRTAAVHVGFPVRQVEAILLLVELADDDRARRHQFRCAQPRRVKLEDRCSSIEPSGQAGRTDEVWAKLAGH